MKREFKNRWLLGLLGMVGIFLFSYMSAQAQDTVQYRTERYESRTEIDDDGDIDDMDDDDDAYGRAKAGIKGGVNFSNLIKGGEVTDNNVQVGYNVGVYGQLFSTKAFAIQPEVLFSTKGNEVTTRFGLIDQETKFNLHYIDIPVLLVFKLGPAAELHAGAYWGYLVGANIDTDGDLGDGFRQLDRDNFQDWDYGLAGGLGFNLGQAVQLGARYSYGLKDVADSEGARRMIGNARNSVGSVYLAINLASGSDRDGY